MPGTEHAVGSVELIVQSLEPAVLHGVFEALGPLAPVDDRRVVLLLQGVHEDLPVSGHDRTEAVSLGQPVERVALEGGDHRAEGLAQRLARVFLEVREDEAGPHVAVHRNQTVVGLVDLEELALLLNERARAVELVPPAVILAHELTAIPARLLPREVGPHELVAAVAADVVECAHLSVLAARDDDRRVREGELFGEVAAGARELLHPAHVQPRPLEDRLPLELVELRGDRVLVGDQTGTELRVVLGPAALGGFGKRATSPPWQGMGSITRSRFASQCRGCGVCARPRRGTTP